MTDRTPGCTCPRCRLGYYPSSYTFGGNVARAGNVETKERAEYARLKAKFEKR